VTSAIRELAVKRFPSAGNAKQRRGLFSKGRS
jgi:hypothetical protein